jgi:hypothetical protein
MVIYTCPRTNKPCEATGCNGTYCYPYIFPASNYAKVIESNVEDEFVKYLDSVIDYKTWIFNNEYDDVQIKLLEQVKEKYLEIKKKNT